MKLGIGIASAHTQSEVHVRAQMEAAAVANPIVCQS